jgi:hypothetical protein
VFGHHLGVERRELSIPIHYLLPIVGSCAQRSSYRPKISATLGNESVAPPADIDTDGQDAIN